MKNKFNRSSVNSIHDNHYYKPWNSVGYEFSDLYIDGQLAEYKVVNERAVRAAAGLMMALAAISVILSYFLQIYWPIRIFTLLAAFDFAMRQITGLSSLSPFGLIANFLVHKQRPEWVGVQQKLFAWSLGIIMASTVAYLVNTGQNGPLSITLCLMCIGLMWMEAVLGICLGCKIYTLLLDWKIIPQPKVKPACPGGVCAPSARLKKT